MNILYYDSLMSYEALESIATSLKNTLSEPTILLPKETDLIYDAPLSTLKNLRDRIDEVIAEKEK